ECPKLKNNNNQGNQGGRNNARARVYAVGHAGADPDANVVTGKYDAIEHHFVHQKREVREEGISYFSGTYYYKGSGGQVEGEATGGHTCSSRFSRVARAPYRLAPSEMKELAE
nr:hypothetical protein [Tanacetum cinerariifolium]